jgi:alkanesulfonate monooxygenase SsuD/methylene tetrahydromethanopterin reductase-like flavin-dependent oxidoreductase (luciferase family)
LQKPHPPIWVGGHSELALKRAGRLADGWHAVGLAPEVVGQQYQQVREHAAKAGRDPNSVGLTIRTRAPAEASAAIEWLSKFRDAGASHAVVELYNADAARARSMMESLARDVRPHL